MKSNSLKFTFFISLLSVIIFFSPIRAYSQNKVRVIKKDAFLRLKPNSESLAIKSISLGAILNVEEILNGWIKVKLPPDEDGIVITGYVLKNMVEEVPERIMVPKLEKPPTIPTKPSEKPIYEEFPIEKRKKRLLQIEFYGGFSTLNPSDLNMRADYEESWSKFFYDDYYDFNESLGYVTEWNKNITGDFKRIKNAIPLGFRLRLNLLKNISLSLGIKYLSKTQQSSVTQTYNSEWGYYWQDKEEEETSPFTLHIKGYAPLIGLNFGVEGRIIGIEAYLTGGPLFAECKYHLESNWEYVSNDGYWARDNYLVEEEGEGTGIAIDAGVRLNLNIISNIGFLVESGYAYQKINKLKGHGTSSYEYSNSEGKSISESDSWEGKWGIKETKEQEDWGTQKFQFPSNHWDDLPPDVRNVRNFVLDLSGIQFRVGFFIGF